MAFYHGIKGNEAATSLSTPAAVAVGITFAIGTAPVYMGEGGVNKVIYAQNYKEAVAQLGYSDDFDTFTLCEVMKCHYSLYGVGPVIFVNVFDPSKHKTEVAAAEYPLTDKQVKLPDTAIIDTVVVSSVSDTSTQYVKGTDYEVFYADGSLIVEAIDGGAITENRVSIAYSKADVSTITDEDIIGGIDPTSGAKTGLELVSSVYPKYGIVPELIIAPGHSHKSGVAAVMAAKAESINGLFKGKALIDADCSTITKYSDVFQWKSDNNISGTNQIVCWPMVSLGGVKYHMSVQLAALMATVDNDNGGIPSESPSNKKLQADSTVLADGTEVILELAEANTLNSKGIVTAINNGGEFVAWGNTTACYPNSADVKDYFIPVNRMFGFVMQTIILTYWKKIDSKMTRRLIDSVLDGINIWLNGLRTAEHILGGRVEFNADENTTTDLMAGKMKFHIFITPPSPAQEMEFTLEYDVEYIMSALAA